MRYKRKEPNPCSKCQGVNIEVSNCGYTTFNCGTAICKFCGKKIEARYGSEYNNAWIIKEWDLANPTPKREEYQIKQEIKKLEKRLKFLQKLIKKQR
jgi:hypothetical protein